MKPRRRSPRPGTRRGVRGVALLIVMVVVLLSSLLALWAFRSSLVNEAIVGNDADYQRAFEAAQAMLQDAEMDIRGQRLDGSLCLPSAESGRVCRGGDTVQFIEETSQLGLLVAELKARSSATGCYHGICIKREQAQDFWNNPTRLAAMTAENIGARYGEYTGALPAAEGVVPNPLLTERRAGLGAWYWIEVMPYVQSQSGLIQESTQMLELNMSPHVIYRITAIAHGLKPNTRVVLQSTFARQKLRN